MSRFVASLNFRTRIVRALFVMVLPTTLFAQNVVDRDAREVTIRSGLIAGRTGRSGRTAFQTDAIAAEMVSGKWRAPVEGEKLEFATNVTWQAAIASEDGTFTNRELRGGYLSAAVTVDQPEVAILDASGHNLVYVNQELRAGDPYSNGILELPVLLKAGTNEFLFSVGRGRLKAKLQRFPAPFMLTLRDSTLPDVVRGESNNLWGAVVLLNCTTNAGKNLRGRARADGAEPLVTELPSIPALSLRKVPVAFRIPAVIPPAATKLDVQIEILAGEKVVAEGTLTLRVRRATEHYKVTFRSVIDGSIQYYGVAPATDDSKEPSHALFLSTHGAGVEGMGQADAYASKSWGVLVAPTNRRPYGFDWEDWGRMDALEVLRLARERFHTDPAQTYLTGHSMGGHGTWQLGVTFPDHFAAIAPSAGWISFASYAGGRVGTSSNAVEALFVRANNPSDTLSLASNYLHHGIYILHGDADDNVPVSEARKMKETLSGFHRDFMYHEQPGAGHWWGNLCVDWPPIFDFFARHKIPEDRSVIDIQFSTANPGISASSHWVTIEAQEHPLERSSVAFRMDRNGNRCSGTTENVSRLALEFDQPHEGRRTVTLELDGETVEGKLSPQGKIRLERKGGKWRPSESVDPRWKGPQRNGPFKEAFRDRMVFVYATQGSAEENAWAISKARFDAETWYYRGNGSVEILSDLEFDATKDPDGGVILYGNAENNAAWEKLLKDSPVQVHRTAIRIGQREIPGTNLACVFCRPRSGSDRAMVAVVSGTGLEGLRTTERLPYFLSGVGFPDCSVFGSETLRIGAEGLRAAGYFGENWTMSGGEFAFREETPTAY